MVLQGICIDAGKSTVLEEGKRYFLFPSGSKHFLVSKFPNRNAHTGCFQSMYFRIVQENEWPEEPEKVTVVLDPEKIYRALLIWRKPGYKFVELKEYYIRSNMTHGFFYHDRDLKKCGGCFPLHWFTNFEIVEIDDNVTETTDFVIEVEENEQFLFDSESEIAKYEQLSLFDL